jgi:hypothetical protein
VCAFVQLLDGFQWPLQIEQLSPFIEFVPKMLTTLFKMAFFGFYLFENTQFAFLSLFGFIYLPVYFVYVEWSGNFWLKWQLPRQKASMDMYSVRFSHP